ncbi:MAG: LCP family protein [Coriobacteriales bacterium]|jgi:LCP family protein required for cell wall assembly
MVSKRSDKKSSSSGMKRDYSRAAHVKSYSRSSRGNRNYSRSQIEYIAPAAEQSSMGGYSRRVSSKNYASMRKKKRRKKRIITAVVVVALAIVVGGAAAAFGYLGYLNNQLGSGIDDMNALDQALVTDKSDSDPFYILLLGTDGREGEDSYRSDTIILGRVDLQAKQVVLISIPRDTRVYIEGYGYNKINAAYAYGGAAAEVNAVEEFAGVQISHYAQIDFSGFSDLVDALGGVEVDVPIDINDPDAGGSVSKGLQTLDGEHALIFCRSRDTAIGDYQRQVNQRIFLEALASKILSSDASTMVSAINAIADAVSTDMDVNEIYSIANSMKGMTSDNIYSYTVPSATETIDGVSYVVADETEWKAMMETIDSGGLPADQSEDIAGVVSEEYQNSNTSSSASSSTSSSDSSSVDRSSYTVSVRNGGGIEGSATEAADILETAGYSVTEIGNANQFVYDSTLVIYNDDSDLDAVNDIISELGKGTAVQSAGRYSFDSDILVVVGSDWSS